MKPWQQLLLGLCFGFLATGILLLVARKPSGRPVELLFPPTPEPIMVHVTGAVVSPGVYELPAGSRVLQAVQAAGGFSDEANQETVNLAASLSDGMMVRVPMVGEELAGDVLRSGTGDEVTGIEPVDLNSATKEDLMRLPNIGPTRAEAIINYRETYGPFQSVEEIINVSGIGMDTYEVVRDLVIVR